MKTIVSGLLFLTSTALLAAPVKDDRVTAPSVATPITVGTSGNEPIVAIAPDGTLYISALQYIYLSTDNGTTWARVPLPLEAQVALATDSSISIAPNNRLYYSFDYPYAGSTAVCTTDNRGVAWTCNPAVVPGGTDRMWVLATANNVAYDVTNQGLYETAFLTSTDGGLTWVPKAIGGGVLEPQTGPLLQGPCSTNVVQPVKIYGTLPADIPEFKLYVYDPVTSGAVLSAVRGTGLGLPLALPSASFGRDGTLYIASEIPNLAGGRQVVVARSVNEGTSWTTLPAIPGTETGTSIFSWVAADEPGHVGVIFYNTPTNGDPGTLTTANWSTMWAETFNADSAAPTWTLTTVDTLIHVGPICVAADCMGTNRFAGDFINAIIDRTGVAHLTWMGQANGTGATSVRYQRIQAGPPSIYQPRPCGQLPLPVQLNTVVSRKVHGGTGPFDIDLPLTGPNGVECRTGGINNQHTLVFTFSNPLHSVDGVSVTSGTGSVSSAAIGTDSHQYVVSLTGVTNQQRITVSLANVQDTAGNVSASVPVTMAVLLGDTNGNGSVNASDIGLAKGSSGQTPTVTSFRNDVTVNGAINSSDISTIKGQSGLSLPPP